MRIFLALLLLSSTCFGQYAPAPTSAAAASLTGTTIASNVVTSSLTALGDLATSGRTLIGTWPANSNYALFGNNFLDQTQNGNYALIQSTTGGTYINAVLGQVVEFRINNSAVGNINASGFSGNGSQLTSLPAQLYSGSFSGAGTATTSFVVTIGTTQANATYKVSVEPTNLLAAAVQYVSAKTTTTFTVTYLAGLTGTVTFDWSVFP